jgi:hypothetical protein
MKKIMTPFFIMILMMMITFLSSCHSVKEAKWQFTFDGDAQDFIAIYADYHDDGHNLETYEFSNGYADIPVLSTPSKGLFIAGHNRSDDLFMGFYKMLEMGKANASYRFTITFNMATKYKPGSVGIGGSPGDSVFVKGGMVSEKPVTTFDENMNLYVLNVDKGNQSTGGETIINVGTLAKTVDTASDEYVFKSCRVRKRHITTDRFWR